MLEQLISFFGRWDETFMHSGEHICCWLGWNVGNGRVEDDVEVAILTSLRMEMVDKMKTSRGMIFLPGIFIMRFRLGMMKCG
ncbi:hypothetical protein M5689_017476 [Euphorbia peplus]|nr:hypothetical protein M5689_017476 [Euphorbia peplus]